MFYPNLNKGIRLLLLTYTVQYFLFTQELVGQEGVVFENPYKKTEPAKEDKSFTLYFSKQSSKIAKADLVRLQSFADFLNQNRNYEVYIQAHANEGKNAKDDLVMSEKRSLEVERFFLIHFVEPIQIRRLFYGNSKLTNKTKEHQALNRRVEIKIQQIP
ncbi:OmpA family protein [Leptospira sp. 2 VSF19]|uniref:OmpA family protein n=1 Tax=Leptospira soteropolitanensis TaxID=2950025 RepID=A0AAW5VQP8_9LEPT|nr:OmpA family protein [Leptospira soteropolitanensis]MCW7493329.1 OmpA family protein [Leptospira soteropolitanensis]MCW7501139.1 OmpA family protein [Leptospira soteropolitanensis]MCW7523181.1 OmpA family protein [Leptospira soteropolitanensis]MCW7527042.1 OmpA family protein [Leptospira soteropolitanensis]MCW7530899.1 OmpA family protein [Leptospira soteropolitanensis]